MKRDRTMIVASVIAIALAGGLDASAGRGAPLSSSQQLSSGASDAHALAAQLDAILQRETARERASDCQNARTTFDENACLEVAVQATTSSYEMDADT